jgi:hypothetical protein
MKLFSNLVRHDEIVMIKGFINLVLFGPKFIQFLTKLEKVSGDSRVQKRVKFMKPLIMTNRA